tara:strand:- start:22871 stop:23689 length:819 start_codon:yes stop_codon:yes gene_type:complete
MKILVIQENGHHDLNRNFRECFCLKRGFKHHGAKVDIWGKGHDGFDTEPVWESYDLIFAIENWDWLPDVTKVRVPKFIWAIDAHCKGPRVYEQYGFDKVLHASPAFAEKDCWLPNCYDDTIIYPLENLYYKSIGIGFCGNVVNRQPYIDILKANFPQFRFDEFVIGADMVEAVNSYLVHWNANIGVDVNYRNFETMGCQTMLLTSEHPAYDSLGIKDGVNCVTYGNTMEMINKARYALDNDNYRDDISKEGYELVKKHHTYKNRAQTILEMI